MEQLADAINQYGFPIIAALGLGYFVYYVWNWTTKEIKPVLAQANATLIALIDRVRMLDNDMIRLNSKLTTILEINQKVKIQQLDPEKVKEIQKQFSSRSEEWGQSESN